MVEEPRWRLLKEELEARDKVRHLRLHLPPPVGVFHFNHTAAFVYRVRTISRLDEPSLLEVVQQARRTYHIYGQDIPLIDSFDHKSAIYLVRFVYRVNDVETEEWFSMRFVWGGGEPKSNVDMDFYNVVVNGKEVPFLDILEKNDMLTSTICQSRVCAIRPYSVNADLQHVVDEEVTDPRTRKNRYSPVGYVLCFNQFFLDHQVFPFNLRYFICQMHENLYENLLIQKKWQLHLMPAYKTLDVPAVGGVFLARRRPGVYVYDYPGYFLDNADLVQAINDLLEMGKINIATLEFYLNGFSWEEVLAFPLKEHFTNLGGLLSIDGPVDNITGASLRDFLDKNVADGPMLWISARQNIENDVRSALESI